MRRMRTKKQFHKDCFFLSILDRSPKICYNEDAKLIE